LDLLKIFYAEKVFAAPERAAKVFISDLMIYYEAIPFVWSLSMYSSTQLRDLGIEELRIKSIN
jgi:hypothetical protein